MAKLFKLLRFFYSTYYFFASVTRRFCASKNIAKSFLFFPTIPVSFFSDSIIEPSQKVALQRHRLQEKKTR
jgi:hypothetical protein